MLRKTASSSGRRSSLESACSWRTPCGRMPRATRYGASSPAPTRRSSTSRSRRRLPTSCSCPATAIAATTVETTMARSTSTGRPNQCDRQFQSGADGRIRLAVAGSRDHRISGGLEPDAIPAEAPSRASTCAPRMRPGSVSTDTIDARPCHPRRRRSSVGRRGRHGPPTVGGAAGYNLLVSRRSGPDSTRSRDGRDKTRRRRKWRTLLLGLNVRCR